MTPDGPHRTAVPSELCDLRPSERSAAAASREYVRE